MEYIVLTRFPCSLRSKNAKTETLRGEEVKRKGNIYVSVVLRRGLSRRKKIVVTSIAIEERESTSLFGVFQVELTRTTINSFVNFLRRVSGRPTVFLPYQ